MSTSLSTIPAQLAGVGVVLQTEDGLVDHLLALNVEVGAAHLAVLA